VLSKFAIVGSGAIGCYYCARLSLGGADVRGDSRPQISVFKICRLKS